MKYIYADYNATSPMLSVVKNYFIGGRLNGPFANPNSLHFLGNKILNGLDQCREIIAEKLSIDKNQIVFNSGSSESITTAFWMSIGQNILQKKNQKSHIICSKIEHAAVIQAALYWEKQGATVHWLNTSKDGIIDLVQLKNLIEQYQDQLALVAVMAANNETGVIQPFEAIANLCKAHQILYLCDTTQIIGKLQIPTALRLGVFFCASGHKLGAPLGSGFLVLPYIDNFQALIMGGEQERHYRSGTQNYLGIEAMTIALKWHYENLNQWQRIETEKNNFEHKVKEAISDAKVIGEKSERLPNTSLISFTGIHSQGMQIELEARNIFVTTSAACSDNEPNTSKVLRAMGINDDEGRSVLRISTGLEFDVKDYTQISMAINESYQQLEKISFSNK